MAGFAEVRFKGTRKESFTYPGDLDVRPGQHVFVEADRGEDLGEVSAVGAMAERKCSSLRPRSNTAGVTVQPGATTLTLTPGPIRAASFLALIRRPLRIAPLAAA